MRTNQRRHGRLAAPVVPDLGRLAQWAEHRSIETAHAGRAAAAWQALHRAAPGAGARFGEILLFLGLPARARGAPTNRPQS